MSSEFLFPCSRIYISNLKSLLNRKDLRSIRNWCKKNHLHTYKDTSGEFVYQTEFELAYHSPLIKALSLKHPTDWKEYYKLYKSGNAYEIIQFIGGTSPTKSYMPKGKITTKLFEKSQK